MEDIPEIYKLFKEQLNNQIKKIVQDNEFDNEGLGFAHWYFNNIRGKTGIEAHEQITDGGGDLGIDAIEIEDEKVIFYQFKNPESLEKSVKGGDIDKLISGLGLILRRDHKSIANPELLERLEDIYSFTPTGYKIVIAFSGMGELPDDVETKLDSFCQLNSGPAKDLFTWEYADLTIIHNQFYTAHLPTLEATIDVKLAKQPYMTKIGDHETYLFDLSGKYLAALYDEHGESLLQQNVRMFEGDRGTNLAIAQTASSESDAKDFFHYNNGISIICDSATYQPFTNSLSLERPQIVNGGQTMRILHKCFKKNQLKDDVHAAVRVITTGRDKEFASNVAVNLNNQTRVDNTFLRSNDPRIVQLLHSLSSKGYFLERRAGELEAMLPDEIKELETRYGSPLISHVIPLKDGMQSYVATYFQDPQLAKKDSSKIFVDDGGGSFSKILQSDLTAEKFIYSYRLGVLVTAEVERFKKIKRKRYLNSGDRKSTYLKEFGSFIESVYADMDPSIPQITIFGMAFIYEKHVTTLKQPMEDVLAAIEKSPEVVWRVFTDILRAKSELKMDKSWPTLLKSGAFFRDIARHLSGSWKKSL